MDGVALHILLIEDDDAHAMIVEKSLRSAGTGDDRPRTRRRGRGRLRQARWGLRRLPATTVDPTGPEASAHGRPSGAASLEGRQSIQRHPNRGADHIGRGRRCPAGLRPARQQLPGKTGQLRRVSPTNRRGRLLLGRVESSTATSSPLRNRPAVTAIGVLLNDRRRTSAFWAIHALTCLTIGDHQLSHAACCLAHSSPRRCISSSLTSSMWVAIPHWCPKGSSTFP